MAAADWEEEGTKAAVQETLASPHPHTPKNLPTHPKNLPTHPQKLTQTPTNLPTHPNNLPTHPKNLPTHPKTYPHTQKTYPNTQKKLTHTPKKTYPPKKCLPQHCRPNKKDPTNEICSHYYKEKSQQSSQWSLTLSLPLSLSFFFHCYCHFILVGWLVGRYSIILNQMFQSSQVSRFAL